MQRGEKPSGRIVSNGTRRWFGKPLLAVACAGLFAAAVYSGWHVKAAGASAGISSDKVWKATGGTAREGQVGSSIPPQACLWQLDEAALQRVFEQALPERNGAIDNSPAILSLPLRDGNLARFRIVDSPVLAPELAAQYPQIKSYRGQGVDNPSLTMRCSWTPSGLSALVIDGAQTVMIQPLAWFRQAPPRRDNAGQAAHDGSDGQVAGEVAYVSYYGQDYTRAAEEAMCLVKGDQFDALKLRRMRRGRKVRQSAETLLYGDTLRTYRIALATTAQYRSAVPGGNVLASINTWLSNVNAFLGEELAINLVLASPAIYNNNYTFTNGDAAAMLDQVRAALNSLDPTTYDIGHVLGTGSGGNAFVGVVCETQSDNTGPYKAGGVTLVSNAGTPGNTTDLIAFLHELGHQLGATHTFNGANGSCGAGGGRTGDTAFELGSGMSIMSLGGSCGSDNIVSARSPFFHSESLAQIVEFLDSFGGGCGTATSTGNAPPVVNAGADYVIPKQTAFTLSGTVSDPAGQALMYSWEQIDAGGAAFANPPYGDQLTDPPESTRPLFLPMVPAGPVPSGSTVTRTFTGGTPGGFLRAESLPAIGRALNFRLTARDNQATGGGVSSDKMQVEVLETSGPFAVTAPNTTVSWAGGSTQTVTWSVNNTNIAPINCDTVRILFSSDGGNHFAVLVNNTANDGTEQVTVPNVGTTQGRIKVEAVGNIFLDISDTNFTVTSGTCGFLLDQPGQGVTSTGGTGNVTVLGGNGCSWTAVSNDAWITVTSGASGNGNGAVSYAVAANSGATRRGTVTIAGQAFTVTQAGMASGNGLMFYPLAHPVRLLDTRSGATGCYSPNAAISGGTSRTQPARGGCDGLVIPANASAVTGNITTVTSGGGYLTLYPSDAAQPQVANSNYNPNEILNNVFTVGLGASDGAFDIFVTSDTDVVVDVTGYYAPPDTGGLFFHPLTKPIRLLDTRAGTTGCTTPNAPLPANTDTTQQAQGTCDGVTIPNTASAIVGNATTVNPQGPGFPYLTLFPADASRPLVASSNYQPGQIMNAPFTVGLSLTGAFKIYPTTQTELIVDVLGYYSADAVDVNGAGLLFNPLPHPVRLLDTRSGAAGCYTPNTPLLSGSTRMQAGQGICDGVTIANNALGVVGNATVVNSSGGYLTFWPSSATQPTAATSNFTAGQVLNRHFTVGLGAGDGAFKIYTQFTTDLIVDVSGYFAP